MDLTTLGYNEKWVEYGLLTEDWLQDQLTFFATGEDPNTEHYRYNTFTNWVKSKKPFSNQEITNYLELAMNDDDLAMGSAALSNLFRSSFLNQDQFEMVKVELEKFNGKWAKDLIERETLKRDIIKEGLNDHLFNKCIEYYKEYNKYNTYYFIINLSDNTEYINRIIENPPSEKIKNVAINRLRDIQKNTL